MIGYLKGKVIYNTDNQIILEVNGVGYELTCSVNCYNRLVNEGGGEVFTYTAVKEDGISLYGFNDLEEKNMFIKLISVSGVGPKVGISIISGMKIDELAMNIASSDSNALSKIKGLGKKTAERIILELREKVESTLISKKGTEAEVIENQEDKDAIIALMSLGFTKQECVNVIAEGRKSGVVSLQELISYSLKHIK